MKRLLVLFPLLVLACEKPGDDALSIYEGETFRLKIQASQTVEKTTPVEDFNLYRSSGNGAEFVIYEGNHPQPGGLEVQTGCGWPSVISIHSDKADLVRDGLTFEGCPDWDVKGPDWDVKGMP